MRRKKHIEKMRVMGVEWRMGEGRRSPVAMDGRRQLARCFSGDADGPGNKEMKCRKVRKKKKGSESLLL